MKQIYILLIALLMGLSANAEKSGTCGPNLKWHLTDDGVLTITGKGEMYDYSYTPWSYDDLTRVIIGNGVTTIGEAAFRSCSHLTSVNIPNSVTTIGGWAFSSCFILIRKYNTLPWIFFFKISHDFPRRIKAGEAAIQHK